MRVLFEIFYWLLIALCPILVVSLANILVYVYIFSSIYLLILVELIGVILGVVLAEYIRKKYGCSSFYSKLMNTPDLDRD